MKEEEDYIIIINFTILPHKLDLQRSIRRMLAKSTMRPKMSLTPLSRETKSEVITVEIK